jgi:hypothetical protein
LSVEVTLGSNEDGPRSGDIQIRRVRLRHPARPVRVDVELTGDDNLFIDIELCLLPRHIVPLDRTHADEVQAFSPWASAASGASAGA